MALSQDECKKAMMKCAVCQDSVTNPRDLPCMHTYCSKCLENLTDEGGTFHCPECADHDSTSEPKSDLCESMDPFIPAQAQCELRSDLCASKDSCTKAKPRCVDCNEILCEKCQNDTTLLKGHNVLCHQCYPVTRPGHPCTGAKGKVVKDLKPIGAIITQGNGLMDMYEQETQETNKYVQQLEQNAENTIAAINNDMNVLIQAIRKKYNFLTEKVLREKEKNKTKVMYHFDDLNSQKAVIEGEVNKFCAIAERGDPLDAKLKEQINKKSEEWANLPNISFNRKIHIEFTEGKHDHIGTEFGKVDVRKVAVPENFDHYKPFCEPTFNCTKLHPSYIHDLAVTPSGNYVIVGRRSVIYDKSLTLKKDLNNMFRHVVLMQDGNLAFTNGSNNTISIYDEDGTHQRDVICRKLTKLEGMTINSAGKMLVIDSWRNQIYSVDLSTKNASVQPLPGKFVAPRYLTSNSQNVNIVSDYGGQRISAVAKHGTEIFYFEHSRLCNDEWLRYPYGICRDEGDYIFVADSNNDRVVLLSPKGKFVKYILTAKDGLSHPYAVTINNDGMLLVGDNNGKLFTVRYRD